MNPLPPSSSANLASFYLSPSHPLRHSSFSLSLTLNLTLRRPRPRPRPLVASSGWLLDHTPAGRSVHRRAAPRAVALVLKRCFGSVGSQRRPCHFHRFDRTQFHPFQSQQHRFFSFFFSPGFASTWLALQSPAPSVTRTGTQDQSVARRGLLTVLFLKRKVFYCALFGCSVLFCITTTSLRVLGTHHSKHGFHSRSTRAADSGGRGHDHLESHPGRKTPSL
ncbi:hypothetical protein FJTKL_03620 [Diaporthe vaccinii]|uniref:Transmembrane protein n=1 Tax=Diaporthe vaccinii TaxID=105482 RepID=A0ABR4DUU1_9PEZI